MSDQRRILLWVLPVLTFVLGLGLGVYLTILRPSPPAVGVSGVTPAASTEILPCGHRYLSGAQSGEIRYGICEQGDSWMYAQGRWIRPPFDAQPNSSPTDPLGLGIPQNAPLPYTPPVKPSTLSQTLPCGHANLGEFKTGEMIEAQCVQGHKWKMERGQWRPG